jgi:hypothetical protein
VTGLQSWQALGIWTLVLRLAAVGAFAGVAAWALVFAADLLLHTGRPDVRAFLLAVPRGAIFGVVLALILGLFWRRSG